MFLQTFGKYVLIMLIQMHFERGANLSRAQPCQSLIQRSENKICIITGDIQSDFENAVNIQAFFVEKNAAVII